jgi:hypothetical protein
VKPFKRRDYMGWGGGYEKTSLSLVPREQKVGFVKF